MNSATELLQELKALNVNVVPNGSNVEVDAPKGVLTEELIGRIRDLKQAILAEIIAESKTSKVTETTVTPRSDTRHAWPPDIADLIQWFIDEGQHVIPTEPFSLCPGKNVTNPQKFKESLLFSISWGPDCVDYRCGCLVDDIRMLKEKLCE